MMCRGVPLKSWPLWKGFLQAAWVFCILVGAFWPTMGRAQVHWQLDSPGYLVDATGDMRLAQAKLGQYTPFEGVLSKGYLSGALWVRVTLKPTASVAPKTALPNDASNTQHLTLLVHPTYLDDIEIHDEATPDTVLRGGQLHAWSEVQSGALAHVFMLKPVQTERKLWIRIKTQTTYILDVRVHDNHELGREEQLQDLMLAVLTSSLLLLALAAVFYAVAQPSRLMGMFAVKQISAFFYGACILGYHRLVLVDSLSPETLALITKWAIVLYALFSVQFHWTFFEPYRPRRWAKQGLMLAMAMAVLSCAMVAVGWVSWGLLVNKLVALYLPLWLMVMLIWGIDWPQLNKVQGEAVLNQKVLLVVHGLMVVFLFMATLPTLGLQVTSFFALYASMVHGALTGVVLLFLVHRQLMLLSQHSLRLAVTTEKSLELERNHRERQAQFLSMLTHELRTPLSVLRLSLGTLMKSDSTAGRHALTAIDDMNNLINRCNQLDQLEQGKQVAQFTRVRLSELIQDVLAKSPGFSHTLVQVDPELFVWSDVVLLQTMLFNLVDNAYKYRKHEGVVRMVVRREQWAGERDERIVLSVSNPLDARSLPDPERMFDKYYRAASAHQTSGTGLGLYIVKGLSKLIGVHVTVSIEPGPEVVLSLILPTELSQLDPTDPRAVADL